MNTLTWVLAGVAAYWLLALFLRNRGLLPDSVQVFGPLLTVHTRRGRRLLNRLARPRRFWRAWGNFGLGIALVVMVGSVLFFVTVAILTVQNPPPSTAVNQPRNVLVIPGVNDFLPPSVALEILAGLAIGLVVHEGGHGILCRVEDIDIESMGLVFLTVLPAGAFVEPDEESQRAASRGGRSRMFAAGVTNNFAVTVIGFLLLFGPVVGSMSVAAGAAVATSLPGSPAAETGIGQGDVITAIDGTPVESNDDLDAVLANASTREVDVTLRDDRTEQVSRSVLVTGAPQDGWPFDIDPSEDNPEQSTIVAVNDTEVDTTAAFRDALADRPVATLRTADGETHTGPAGVYVVVAEDGALADAGAPATDPLVITAVDGERVLTGDDLMDVLEAADPGQQVSIAGYTQSGQASYDVEMGTDPDGDGAHLGVFASPGVSGLAVTDLGIEPYPAGRYLGALGGDCEECTDFDISGLERVVVALQLPLAGIAGSAALPYNFAGFTGGVQNFYVVEGVLGALGGGAFLFANLLFWTAWINLNLAAFNCIPTFMLDGGHMFRAAVESVVARLPVERGARLVTAVTVAVQFAMLASLGLLLFGAELFG